MNRVRLKKEIIDLLATATLPEVYRRIENFQNNELISPLLSCFCHPVEQVRWRAISVFGRVVSACAERDIEQARVVMRRCLWMLNDESGGIGWGVPEAMAEIMYHSEPLAAEYLHMLVSYTLDDGPELYQNGNFIELPALQQGVLWGLCRVASKRPKRLKKLVEAGDIKVYFVSRDAQVRGLACRLAGILRLHRYERELAFLHLDPKAVRIYEEGGWAEHRVGTLARRASAQLNELPSIS